MTTPDAPNAGSATVSIVPDLRGFAEGLRAQVLPIAQKVGSDVGQSFSGSFKDEVAARTKDAVVGPDQTTVSNKGRQSGGAFADGFKARVEAALKTLPPISIGAATTEAEQKIRDLKVDLATLASQRIGVEISDDEAIAKLDDLRARLAEINGESSNVQVKADTAAALAQLDRFKAEIDKLKTEEVHVDVDVDDHGSAAETVAEIETVKAASSEASSGINDIGNSGSAALPSVSLLGSAIFAFGPAAVGAAAVAIPAIIAIGAAATGAVAGLAVLGLGFSGILGALQASGQKPSTSAGNQGQSSALSSQSQKLSAQQATQSATDQLTSSIEREQQAEVSLRKAQTDSVQAQKDLTAARVQAEQDLQDLGNSVTDNALAQRQAAITLAQAQQTLSLDQAAPGANLPQYQQQIAQAQLAVDQAKQGQAELVEQGQRLATQQKQANAAGVDGAAGVVSAQQRVVDTQNALVQAQQSATDSAHQLAEAQANIGLTAQRNAIAAQQAAISTANAAGATDQFGQAMAKLNPIQQQFVEFLLGLKPLFDDLKGAASGFLPGLEQGIKDAAPAFQPLLAIVGNVAQALGQVFTAIGQAFAGPEGQKFLGFLATELPTQIGFLGTLFIQFGRIFSGVFEQFAPLIKIIDTAVVGFFTNLGDKAQNNGFAGFIKEITPLIGPVFSALSAFGDLIVAAFQAILPAIQPSIGLFTTLAKVLTGLLTGPVGKGLGKLWGDLLSAITPLLPLLGKLIAGALPPFIALFDQLATKILPQLIPFLGPFVNAFIGLVQALAPAIVPIIQGISDALVAIGPLMPQLAASFQQLVVAITNLVPALVPLLPPLIQLAVQVITGNFIQQMTLFVGLFAELLIVLTPLLVPILQISADIGNLQIRLESFVQTLTGKLIGAILGFGTNVTNHLLGPLQDVGNFLSGLPGKISSLATDVYNAGANLMSSLLNGFLSAGGAVGNFAKSIVNDVIDALNVALPHHFTLGVDEGPVHLHQTIPLFPTIPPLANGGIIPASVGGQFFLGGEGGSPEAVLPLNPKNLGNLANMIVKPLSQAGLQSLGNRLSQTNNFYGYQNTEQIARAVGKATAARSS